MFFYSVTNAIALLVTVLADAAFVCTERSLGTWKSRAYLALDRVLYKRCSRILTNSRATTDFVTGGLSLMCPGPCAALFSDKTSVPS